MQYVYAGNVYALCMRLELKPVPFPKKRYAVEIGIKERWRTVIYTGTVNFSCRGGLMQGRRT